VSAAAETRPAASANPAQASPWLIAFLVALAAFMEVLDTTVANVVLPYIAGGMGVSTDEASWVVTTYLVANAVSLTASPFLARRLGRKTFFIACLGLFTLSSLLCAQAWNLDALLLFRIMQGLAGGGMVPVSQSILADAFPPAKRGQAFALFGIAVVVGPVVGPTLGGWLADNVSWRWCFLINFPVGLATMAAIAAVLPADAAEARSAARFDAIGFLLIATFLGALEVVLDRGLEDDWFGSSFIRSMTVVTAAALALLIPWETRRKDPMIDVRMVASRQFGAAFLVMGATGAILYATTQFLPLLLQTDYGYTATWAGLALSPGGIVTMFMMFLIGSISNKVQPKYLIMIGALVIAASMYELTDVYGDLNFWFFARSRIYLGIGLPLIFIPIIAASYDGVPPDRIDMASALINAARNTGGSIGVSIASNVVAHREQFHQARLAENAIPASAQYRDALQQATKFFQAQGGPASEAQQRAIAWIGREVALQASFLAYMDVFWVLMILALLTVPLALTLRNVKLGGAAPAAH